MSEQLIASLNEQLKQSQALVGQQKASKNKVLDQLRQAQAKITELEKAQAELAKERESLAAKPVELEKQVSALQAALRSRDHRDAFAQVIGPELQDGVPVEDIWAKIGFDPSAVEAVPTPDQIAALVAPAREKAAYLFRSAQSDPAASSATPASQGTPPSGAYQARPVTQTSPPPGAGRAPSAQAVARVRYSEKEVQVPGWQTKNPALAEALREGRADCIDG